MQWFLRSYFGMLNGFKCDKISVPQVILDSKNEEFILAFLQGLFDSDGTITKKGVVSYASTSKEIAEQVFGILNKFGINARMYTWIKNKRFLPLYSIVIKRRNAVLRFSELIGFKHPIKTAKLSAFINNSPVV